MLRTTQKILFWLLLAVGTVCCAVLLVRRAAAEESDRRVAFAISYGQVRTLSEAGGQPEELWLRRLSAAGVRYLIGTDENEPEARAAAERVGMSFARSGSAARPGDAFLLPPVDEDPLERDPVKPYAGAEPFAEAVRPMVSSEIPLALVENRTRTGVIMPEGFDPNDWDGPMVQTIYLYAEYRQNFLDEDATNSPEDILFLAVTDREARLIVLTALTPYRYDTGEIVADPAGYEELIGNLAQRLEARGLTVGGEFSMQNAPRRSAPLLAGAALLPVALLALFLRVLLPAVKFTLKPLWDILLLVLGTLAALGGAFAAPVLFQKLVAFGTAVLAACWAALWLACLAFDGNTRWRRLGAPMALRFPLALLGLLACSLAGGLCVGALLADRAYLLEFRVFTGVKLAQLLPLLFSAAVLFVVLYRKNARDGRRKVSPVLVIALGICVAAALVVLLLRSGDNAIVVSAAELRARNWLERTLYARPRTKEFLLAFPALALFVTACERRVPVLALPLGVLATVGATSVVNTFCHIFTPLRVSMARTLLGIAIGLVIGWIAMAVFSLLLGKGKGKTLANDGME